jgi:septum formation protein
LASSSPRRRELLRMIGLDFIVETSGEEEVQPVGLAPADYVKTLALQKACP